MPPPPSLPWAGSHAHTWPLACPVLSIPISLPAMPTSPAPFPAGYRPLLCPPCRSGHRHDLCTHMACNCLMCASRALWGQALARSSDPLIRGLCDLHWQAKTRTARARQRPYITVTCHGCGKPVQARRRSRRYCTDACKHKHYRALARARRESSLMANAINDGQSTWSDWWAHNDGSED